jgi:hypothetical protein
MPRVIRGYSAGDVRKVGSYSRNFEHAFPNWYAVTSLPSSDFWRTGEDLNDKTNVGLVLDFLNEDLVARWKLSPEEYTKIAEQIILDIGNYISNPKSMTKLEALSFLRFMVSSICLHHSVIHGRPSLMYNWIICSLCDQPYHDVVPGIRFDVNFQYDRPWLYLISPNPDVQGYAWGAVLQWYGDLYYAGWKFSLHHELAELVLPEALKIIAASITHEDEVIILYAVEAASQLAAWLGQTGDKRTGAVAIILQEVLGNPKVSAKARKSAGIALAHLQHHDVASSVSART